MKNLLSSVALLAAAALLPFASQAQSFRTYLASYGSDANAGCTVTAPCRLLPAALNAVLDGGEIWILDSANYNAGTVNITKSVSILAVPGQIASVVAVGGTEAINISTSGVKVALRNIVIPKNANNPGSNGIVMTNGSLLSIEDCLFANLAAVAVYVHDTTANVQVKNSVFRNIGSFAIQVQNGPTAVIANSQFLTTEGLVAYGTAVSTTSLTVSESTISNGSEGVWAYSTVAGAVVRAYVMHNTIHAIRYSLESDVTGGGNAAMFAGGNKVAGIYNWWISGGLIYSYGNNEFASPNASGTLTPVSRQ